jgi:fumarate reductase subunit C
VARIELVEMISGLLLVFFMWGHLIMLGSILFGEDTMNGLAQFLESIYLAQIGAVGIAFLVLFHFFAAGRKLPLRLREQAAYWKLAGRLRHMDTWLWLVQAVTGMMILVFVGIHLWFILTTFPIQAEKSSVRVAEALGWLYAPMILVVELHLGVGLYRILVKWTTFNREMGSAIKWAMTAAFVVVGYWILWTFWTIGLAHLQ